MYVIDFQYAEHRLSDLGYMVAEATTQSSDNVDLGSSLTQNVVLNKNTYKNSIVNNSYDKPIEVTFDVIKYDCSNPNAVMTDNEIAYMMRWLNRKQYLRFQPIYDDLSFPDVHYYGTFKDVKLVYMHGNPVGLNLTFTSNSPFGYMDEITNSFSLPENGTFTIYNFSDEIGILMPKLVQVTIKENGIFSLFNTLDYSNETVVSGCSEGEVIKFYSEKEMIESTDMDHIFNRFNYVYPILMSTYAQKENTFITQLPCDLSITYEPIRKVGIIV